MCFTIGFTLGFTFGSSTRGFYSGSYNGFYPGFTCGSNTNGFYTGLYTGFYIWVVHWVLHPLLHLGGWSRCALTSPVVPYESQPNAQLFESELEFCNGSCYSPRTSTPGLCVPPGRQHLVNRHVNHLTGGHPLAMNIQGVGTGWVSTTMSTAATQTPNTRQHVVMCVMLLSCVCVACYVASCCHCIVW